MSSTVLDLMTKALGSTFADASWNTWRAVLKAAHAIDLTDDERAVVTTLTQRDVLPSSPVRELWLLLGRRSGKSIIAALLAVYATTCRSYTLAPGEVGVFMIVAADRKQARVIKRYISGLLRAHPSLEVLIEKERAEILWLTNGLCIEIHTCSFRSLRGYTCIGAACDEIAFWDDEDSANPDHEVLVALRAAMASVPDAQLIALTSVYARRGEVWRTYDTHFGKDSPDVLVVNGATTTMNPTIHQHVIDAAYADDPMAAAAEYGADFRRDLEAFIGREVVEACVIQGRFEVPPTSGVQYVAFCDPSGGSADSFTLAVAHRPADPAARIVLDCVRETRPPFSPETVVQDYAALLKSYRATRVVGDRYAGEWPREQFRKCGIEYVVAASTKSELYRDLLPVLNSTRVELLDDPRLFHQLLHLERRVGRSGRDAIDHAPRQHDDVINAVAGAVLQAAVAQRLSPAQTTRALQAIAATRRPSPWNVGGGGPSSTAGDYTAAEAQDAADGGTTVTDTLSWSRDD